MNMIVVQVHSDLDVSMKHLQRKLQKEGIIREQRLREYYAKPSVRKANKKAESNKRRNKLARKNDMDGQNFRRRKKSKRKSHGSNML